MKLKYTFKFIICLMLSCSLCVSAPLGRFQRIESHAAVTEVVVLSAATLLTMYLASVGVNYVFSNMTGAEAKEYINGKWEEWKSITGNNPNISPNGSWKWGKLGQIIIGAGLAYSFKQFTDWLLGTGTANAIGPNELVQVQSGTAGYYLTSTGIKVYRVNILRSEINQNRYRDTPYYDGTFYDFSYYAQHLDESIPNQNNPSLYTASRIYNGNGYQSIDLVASWGGSIARAIFNTITASPQDSHMLSAAPLITSDNVLFWEGQTETGKYYAWVAGTSYVDVNRFYDEVEEDTSGVIIKTGAVDLPLVDANDNDAAVVVNNPFSTVVQDEDGVPIPLDDAGLWERIVSLVLENSAVDVTYSPDYEIIEDYADIESINSTTYDVPLTSEEEDIITGITQPAWADFRAGDVPAFAQDVWNYFLKNHNWNQLKQKFPFSLPYDAYLIANIFFDTSYDVMDELPTAPGSNRRLVKASNAPVYSFAIPKWDGTTYELELDFSLIDPWQPIIRAAVGVLFTVGLIVGVL